MPKIRKKFGNWHIVLPFLGRIGVSSLAKARANVWITILVLLCGIVVGSFIGQLLVNVPYFSWLSFGKTFGIDTIKLNFSIVKLVFGFTFQLNLASILGMLIALIVYKLVRR